jgi:cytochrome b561
MQNRYSKSSIILHALQGVMLLFILLTGSLILEDMPNNIDKVGSYKIHMIVGLVIFILTFIRIVFILKSPDVTPLHVDGIRAKLIKINHVLIYVVVIAMAVSGIVLSQLSGLGEIVFFGANKAIPNLEEFLPYFSHVILSKVLMFLIVMHVVGVFSYMYKTKENILTRMWFK